MQVIIVGAGIWGLASAYACARRGDQVTVYDAGELGTGASGGIVGAMAPLVPDLWTPKKQFQLEALDSAPQFWGAVDDLSGLSSGYGRIGRYQPLQTERALELATARVNDAKLRWPETYHWTLQPCPDVIAPSAAAFGVVHDTLSARIFPAMGLASLAKACDNLGVILHQNHAVDTVTSHQINGVWGSATADAVVLSPGAQGFGLIDPMVPLHPVTGVKGQAALLGADLRGTPQIYADGIYIIPHENQTVALGSTSETTWTDLRTDSQLDAVIARARTIVPALRDAPITKRWAGLRPKARRRDPMVGQVPELNGVFAAMGPFKLGFSLAHKLGEVMADMIHHAPVSLPESFTVEWHLAG